MHAWQCACIMCPWNINVLGATMRNYALSHACPTHDDSVHAYVNEMQKASFLQDATFYSKSFI